MAALKKVNGKWTKQQIFYFAWLLISVGLFYSFIYNDILETMCINQLLGRTDPWKSALFLWWKMAADVRCICERSAGCI